VLIDAMAICANPTKELLQEAQDAFGEDMEVATIVSIGAGKGNAKVVFEAGGELGIGNGLRKGMAMCKQVHNDLYGRLQNTKIYYRFNMEREMSIHPEEIFAEVSTYLREKPTSAMIDSAVKSIDSLSTGVKLKDISEYPSISILALTVHRFGHCGRDCTQATAIASQKFRRSW
jgi:hypothetical protein